MRTLLILSIAAILLSGRPIPKPGYADGAAGLYLTSADFLQQRLTFEINCRRSGDKIKTNELLGSSTGYVLLNGERHPFDKNKIYGYRSCHNKTYRFYNGEAYLIVDTAGFFIYYQYRQEEISKGKGLVKKDEYFFSKNADGDLKPLTVENVKASYPSNTSFHYALDANFKSDKDLVSYDSFRKEYKIKYLYYQCLK